MANSYQPYAVMPLQGRVATQGPNTLSEKAFHTKLQIRGNSTDKTFLKAASSVFKCNLPIAANTVGSAGPHTIFWLGPDEWEIHSEGDQADVLVKKLTEAFDGMHTAVVDVSDYYTSIRLQGEHVKEIFAKGSPLDSHESVLPFGSCAQTRFAKSSVLIHMISEDCMDIRIRISLAEYCWNYLFDASKEYSN